MAIAWLSAAETVAKFQRFCGKRREVVPDDDDDDKPGSNAGNVDVTENNQNIVNEDHNIGNGQCQTNGNGASDALNGHASVNGLRHRANQVTSNSAQGTSADQPAKEAKTKVTHKYGVLWAIFWLASMVGEEEFFIIFLPIMFWNFDFFVGRRVVLTWFFAMYSGTALKDVIRIERPSEKVVIREANDEHCREYGLPSTHTISGAAITAGLVYNTYMRYNLPLLPTLLIAAPLIICMGLSRLYTGHHSVMDVLAALGLVGLVVLVGAFTLEFIDGVYMTPSFIGPLCTLLTGVVCILFYPHAPDMRESSKDMPIIVAVFYGFYLGLWVSTGINPKDNRHLEPYDLPAPDIYDVLAGVLRYVSGVLLLVIVRFVLRGPSIKFFSRFADPSKGPAKEQLRVVICYRLVTYGGTCAACTALGPLWFKLLGIPVQAA